MLPNGRTAITLPFVIGLSLAIVSRKPPPFVTAISVLFWNPVCPYSYSESATTFPKLVSRTRTFSRVPLSSTGLFFTTTTAFSASYFALISSTNFLTSALGLTLVVSEALIKLGVPNKLFGFNVTLPILFK